MTSKKTKEEKEKAAQPNFGPTSKGVEQMFEKMRKCCMGEEGTIDCSAMPDGMMKEMMEKCCGPRAECTKTDNEQEKS